MDPVDPDPQHCKIAYGGVTNYFVFHFFLHNYAKGFFVKRKKVLRNETFLENFSSLVTIVIIRTSKLGRQFILLVFSQSLITFLCLLRIYRLIKYPCSEKYFQVFVLFEDEAHFQYFIVAEKGAVNMPLNFEIIFS